MESWLVNLYFVLFCYGEHVFSYNLCHKLVDYIFLENLNVAYLYVLLQVDIVV